MYFLILVLVVIFFIGLYFKRKLEEAETSPQIASAVKGYRLRTSLLTRSETALMLELKNQLRHSYYIFPKMRLGDIVETLNGNGYNVRRNRVLPKHIDFTICDSNFRPIFSIELNGKSHQNPTQIKSDLLKKAVFAEVGLPLEVVSVGGEFKDQVRAIISKHIVTHGEV
jgi:hypothetical protein